MLKTDDNSEKKVKIEGKVLFFTRFWRFILRIPLLVTEYIIESFSNRFRFSLSFRITSSFFFMALLNFVIVLVFMASVFYYNGYEYKMLVIFVKYYLLISVVLLYLFVEAGRYISAKLLSPIDDMTASMKKISSKNLDYRLDASQTKDELKELVEHFNSMMDEIELAYEKKTQFVSDASHELRTPISIIGGYMTMLKRWGKTDEAILDESIEAVIDEADQMKNLVEKLLFLARSDRNKLEFEMAPVNISRLIKEMHRETEVVAPDKNLMVKCDSDDYYVIGSSEMIKQMLRVFLENSLKFTEANGEITFFAIKRGKNLEFGVEDNGIGISEEDLPHVFDRFYKADKSRTNKASGSGLGLSIAKLIIVAHDADVHINSKLGFGTKVSIIMPIFK